MSHGASLKSSSSVGFLAISVDGLISIISKLISFLLIHRVNTSKCHISNNDSFLTHKVTTQTDTTNTEFIHLSFSAISLQSIRVNGVIFFY